jgi:hypothetical protein
MGKTINLPLWRRNATGGKWGKRPIRKNRGRARQRCSKDVLRESGGFLGLSPKAVRSRSQGRIQELGKRNGGKGTWEDGELDTSECCEIVWLIPYVAIGATIYYKAVGPDGRHGSWNNFFDNFISWAVMWCAALGVVTFINRVRRS